jgi:peptide/nickel transport system substrate-binding protein
VKASCQYYTGGASPWASLLPKNATYDDSDPQALKIKSDTALPDLGRNATSLVVISPKLIAAGADAVNKTPTGTGPFKFVSYTTAKSVVVAANTGYRGPGPYLEGIEFQIIPDASTRASALRSGAVDLVRRMSTTDVAPLRTSQQFKVTEKPVSITTYLWLFQKYAPTDNTKIRQAIAYGIDRQAIVKSIFGGDAARAIDSVLPPDLYGYKSPATQYKHDPNRAKQLVHDSGLPTPVAMECVWATETGGSHGRVLEAISGELKQIGIDLKVTNKPVTDMLKNMSATYQRATNGFITDVGWGFTGGPLIFSLDLFSVTDQIDDPKFTNLQSSALTTPDGPRRLQMFADLQEYLAEQVPVVPLYEEVAIDAFKSSVQGYTTPGDGVRPEYGPVYLS